MRFTSSFAASMAIAATIAVPTRAQGVVHVQAGAPSPGSGTAAAPYPSIQQAIFAAGVGETVLVGPGVYSERIRFWGLNVGVSSASGAASTFIHSPAASASSPYGSRAVVVFHDGEGPGAKLTGFTLRYGYSNYDENDEQEWGGGVSVYGSSPTIEDCVITDCLAVEQGGGGIGCFGGAPRFRRCDVIACHASGDYNIGSPTYGGVYLNTPDARFENCRILGCMGQYGSPGDGYGKYDCHGPAYGGPSGVFAVGPGPALVGDATFFQFVNCLIAENVGGTATNGGLGGFAGVIGNLTLANCSIINNVGGTGGDASISFGCPLVCAGVGGSAGISGAFLRNCIAHDNLGGAPGAPLASTPGCASTAPSVSNVLFSPGIEYSNVKGVVGGPGNFDVDPQLVNYRPTAGSPGVDAGANLVVDLPATDLDGAQRVRHLVVDQGAFESDSTTCRGAVGLSAGVPIPTLSVNGAVFAASMTPGTLATIAMAAPPGGGPAPFLIFGRVGLPAPTELIELPGIGEMCFAHPLLAPADPFLFVLADNILHGPALAVSTPAPWSSVLAAPPFDVVFVLQGVIDDPTAASGCSLTNAVRVEVTN